MEEEASRIAAVLKVLANENRLRILCELIHGPSAVGALGEKIGGISQSALSQHLALLKAHGTVIFSQGSLFVDVVDAGGHVLFVRKARLQHMITAIIPRKCAMCFPWRKCSPTNASGR